MRKTFILLFICFVSIFFFTHCSKEPDFRKQKTVYVAGVEIDYSKSVSMRAILWTNGVPTYLTAENVGSNAEKVHVAGKNVYVAGSISSANGAIATLWKNEVPIALSGPGEQGQGLSVFATMKDVYVTGTVTENEQLKAVLWKNGIRTYLEGEGGYPFSVYVAGNDVYVTGYATVNGTSGVILWKNGKATVIQADPVNGWAEGLSVFVSGKDIYIAGFISDINGEHAAVWKNGKLIRYQTNYTSWANSIFVNGKDVYVAGFSSNPVYGSTGGGFWLNENFTLLSTPPNGANCYSIFLDGKDVYVSGFQESITPDGGASVPQLWVNGISQSLPINSSIGYAHSVYVD